MDLVESTFAILGAAILFAAVVRALPRAEHSILWQAFGVRVVFSLGNTALHQWHYGGDMNVYMAYGGRLAARTLQDPTSYLPELFLACFGREPSRGLALAGEGTTANMKAMVGMVMLAHDSVWAVGLWFGLLSFCAQAFAYVGALRFLGARWTKEIRLAFLFTPSLAFWTASITKETVAVAGLSLFFYGMTLLPSAKFLPAAVLVAVGALVMLASKPYLLISIAVALAAYGLRRRRTDPGKRTSATMRLLRPVFAVGLALGAAILPGRVSNALRPDAVLETANLRRNASYESRGGSDFGSRDSGGDNQPKSLAYLPIGLTAALFRPFFFEARNPAQLLNVVETTGVLYLVLRMLWRRGPRQLTARAFESPELLACFAFTFVTAVAVGMSSPNLGTISRYRVPMMPFYVVAILILNKATRTRAVTSGASVAPKTSLVPAASAA